MELRQGTAIKVQIGEFVDKTDGLTPETTVALGVADEAELLKHGSTSVVDISGRTWGAITGCDGHYSLSLTTADTDTQGNLRVIVQDDSLCLPVWNDFQVVTQQYWDSKYATDKLHVNTVELSSGAQSAVDLKDFADAGYNPATNYTFGTSGIVDGTTALQTSTTAILAGTTALQTSTTAVQADVTNIVAATTAIWAETTGLQAKLPTNFIMGSTGAGDYSDNITTIQTGVADLQTSTTAIVAETTAISAAIGALNDISTTDIQTISIDTGVNLVEALKRTIAILQGDVSKSTNAYTYDNMGGTTYLTLTSSSAARTRST